MRIFKNLAVLAFIFVCFPGLAQNTDQVKKKGPDDTYARSSISYVLLDFPNERFAPMLRDAIRKTSVPSKFDNNDINKKVIQSPYNHGDVFPNTTKYAQSVLGTLTAEKYAIDIVKYWWKIRDDGSFSTDLIAERGEYNATDFDYQEAMASKVGRAKISDQGLKLIGNSYVLVLDYHTLKTMDEIYDEQDKAARKKAEKEKTEFKPVKRTKNGFTGKLNSYLFQVNYPDTVQGYFDASFINEQRIDIAKLDKIFDQVYSPLKLVKVTSENVEGTQPNPGEFMAPSVQKSQEELMVVLVNNGIKKTLDNLETNLEAFRVKAPVTNVNPIRAKIGRKEGLTHERRYFVWEYVGDKNDNVIAKKKGVIRASKVIDNRQDELGQTRESSFYQIGGGKVSEGMTLQEAKDFGMGLSAGFGSDGFVMRFDLNGFQYLDFPVKQLKIYGDLGITSKEMEPLLVPVSSTTFPNTLDNFTFTKLALGICKEYPFMRNFHFAWYAGYGFETVTWDDAEDKENLTASGIQYGARFGMNLGSPSFQLIGSLNGYGFGNVSYTPTGEDATAEDLGIKWADMFPDKPAVSFNLSLRLNF